jgi:RNA polymerase sigma factor (sigma-70 family)
MDALADYLRDHRLTALFLDGLGWDRASGTLALTADGRALCFHAIAQKRGVQVLWCSTDRVVLANRGLLCKFQKLVARTVHEHVLIFSSEEPRKQVWGWAVRLPDGRKLRHREHPFFSATPPGPFLDRLERLRFSLEEEDNVSLLDTLDRVRRVLDTTPELELFAKRPRYAERSDALARAMQQGDVEAFHRFIELHCPLAQKLSKRLHRWFGMPSEDAEQIAVLGLLAAARRFRPERGFQFSTYATWWINQACQRHGPTVALLIHVPVNVFWTCFRHAIDVERLRMAGGPSSVREQLAELEILNPWLAERWRAYLRARDVGTLSDRYLLREARTIPDPARPPLENLLRGDTADRVRTALGRLHPRDAEVIRLRYGLDGEELTLEQIGQQMNLTRERIRQIELRAEAKLRTLLHEEFPESTAVAGDGEPANIQPHGGHPLQGLLAPVSTQVAASQDTRTLTRNCSG